MFEDTLLSDDPLTELDDELFGRSHLVERIIEVLGNVQKQSTSSTIGLVGSWGSGKSSVLSNVVSRVRTPDAKTTAALGDDWLVAEFNPWLFADSRALHAGFFTMLRDVFPETEQWKDVRGKFIELGRFIAPTLGLATSFFGGDAGTPGAKLLDQFEQSPMQQHADVAKKLEARRQPILIVLDDLDRLTADELLEVFKLVRLVGRLPYVYYILSYDEHTLVDLLAKTDLVSANDNRRALDYLEKIVQVRMDMPLLRPFEIDRVVDRLLLFLARKHQVDFDDETMQVLSRRFDDVMSKRLRTPRSLKRLFGQIDAFLPAVGNEVHFGDYVVVTWLRTMEPGVYDLIQRRRSPLLDIQTDAERAADAPKKDWAVRRNDWMKDLSAAHVAPRDAEDVLWLLSTLFPALGDAYRAGSRSRNGDVPPPEPGRINHVDYFDRFFAFGVPTDDIPDVLAREGLQDIIDGLADESPRAARLLAAYEEDPRLAMRKISQVYRRIRRVSPALFEWTAERWRDASDRLVRGRLENLCATFSVDFLPDDVEATAGALMGTDDGLLFVSHLRGALVRATRSMGPDREALETSAVAWGDAFDSFVVCRFTELAREYDSPLGLPDVLTAVARKWTDSNAPAMKEFLESVVPTRWSWIDTLMWLAPVNTPDEGKTYFLDSSSRADYYYRILDLDTAAVECAHMFPISRGSEDFDGQEATMEVRRAFALHVLEETAEYNEMLGDVGPLGDRA